MGRLGSGKTRGRVGAGPLAEHSSCRSCLQGRGSPAERAESKCWKCTPDEMPAVQRVGSGFMPQRGGRCANEGDTD